MLSASALPIASMDLASAPPTSLIRSASARAASTVFVLQERGSCDEEQLVPLATDMVNLRSLKHYHVQRPCAEQDIAQYSSNGNRNCTFAALRAAMKLNSTRAAKARNLEQHGSVQAAASRSDLTQRKNSAVIYVENNGERDAFDKPRRLNRIDKTQSSKCGSRAFSLTYAPRPTSSLCTPPLPWVDGQSLPIRGPCARFHALQRRSACDAERPRFRFLPFGSFAFLWPPAAGRQAALPLAEMTSQNAADGDSWCINKSRRQVTWAGCSQTWDRQMFAANTILSKCVVHPVGWLKKCNFL